MEKQEIKVSDLARIWDVSVNTTWKRIKKEGLLTVNKSHNNREITFVIVDEAIIAKHTINNAVNTLNEGVNEDLLTPQSEIKQSFGNEGMKEVIEHLLTVDEQRNERVNKYVEEIITYKSQALFLEDKQKGQEALYLNEINTLTRDKNTLLKVALTVISIMSIFLITLLSLYIVKLQTPTIIEKPVIKEVIKEVPIMAPAKPEKMAQKR